MVTRTMGMSLCNMMEMSTTLMNCNCGTSTVLLKSETMSARLSPRHLVHAGHDAEHLGPDDRERNTARRAESPAKPNLHMPLPEKKRNTVLLVHIGHDAEHLGPVNDNREHSEKSNKPNQPSTCHCQSRRRAGRKLSSWSIPTRMPNSLGLPT